MCIAGDRVETRRDGKRRRRRRHRRALVIDSITTQHVTLYSCRRPIRTVPHCTTVSSPACSKCLCGHRHSLSSMLRARQTYRTRLFDSQRTFKNCLCKLCIVTSPEVRVRSIVISVCLSVCLRAYLKNHTSKFHQIFCT